MTLQEKTLFRGKRVIDGEWVTGNYVNCYRPGTNKTTRHFIVEYPGEYFDEIYTSTVGQYTGLNDRNGKRIFDGDIIQAHLDEQYPENVTTGVVGWGTDPHLGWFVEESHAECRGIGAPDPLGECDIENWEVVGNIYDNPELMEVQNENG